MTEKELLKNFYRDGLVAQVSESYRNTMRDANASSTESYFVERSQQADIFSFTTAGEAPAPFAEFVNGLDAHLDTASKRALADRIFRLAMELKSDPSQELSISQYMYTL